MPSKKQKDKGTIYRQARIEFEKAKFFAMPKDEFINYFLPIIVDPRLRQMLSNHLLAKPDAETMAKSMIVSDFDINTTKEQLETFYDSYRRLVIMPGKDVEYLSNVSQLIKENDKDEYILYFPMFRVLNIEVKEKVGGITIKSLHEWDFHIKGREEPHVFFKGEKNILMGNQVLESIALTIYNKTQKKLFTTFTDFEQITTEKIVEKTKVITQDRKTGIDQKKLQKAIDKTRHTMSKKWMPNVVDDVLQELKKNLTI